jgi:predicted nucleic acid-binding protein
VRRVVADASALAALVFLEAEASSVAGRLEEVELWAPRILEFELANVAWKKMRRHPEKGVEILATLRAFFAARRIMWVDIDLTDVVLTAQQTGLTPYDASYLWLAGSIGADLVTLDQRLAATGADGPV